MKNLEKLILGKDNSPQLISPFGTATIRHFKCNEVGKYVRKNYDEEVEEKIKHEKYQKSLFDKFKLTSCLDLLQKHKPKLTTGCKYIDEFLKGGIPSGRLFEVFGEGSTGKTQFICQLMIHSVLPEEFGGLGGKALAVLTGKTLSEKRFNEIKDNILEQNPGSKTCDEVDRDLKLLEISQKNVYESFMEDIEKKVENDNIKCLIIDNIASICEAFSEAQYEEDKEDMMNKREKKEADKFRFEKTKDAFNSLSNPNTFGENENEETSHRDPPMIDYIKRAEFLAYNGKVLKRLAEEKGMVVITVNTVSADMAFKNNDEDPTKMFTEKYRARANYKASLGNTWTYQVNDRICFQKIQRSSNNFTRKLVVDKSSHWPHVTMEFEIHEGGIKGVIK
ncbi:unnamed protein product [Moneuplotes crassus]|uniref:RecA family profile 1 domain-containing protein n=1 Tax=Euplotes crassus TaxID=5936 RepID=A0AAD1Y490_EUPCR|nr:unnamed protein product [Moneuplotes crassus]